VVEGGPIDILRMGRKVVADRRRKIGINAVGHGLLRMKRRGDACQEHSASNSAQELPNCESDPPDSRPTAASPRVN